MDYIYSRLPITRTFKGNRKKVELLGVRVIGSSGYRELRTNDSRMEREASFMPTALQERQESFLAF